MSLPNRSMCSLLRFFFNWVANFVRLLHWGLDLKIINEHENDIWPSEWYIVKVICIFSIRLFSPIEKKLWLIGFDPFIIVMYSHRLVGTPCCEPSQSVAWASTAALMLLEDLHAERCLTASTPGFPDPSLPLVSLSSLRPDKTPEPHCGLFFCTSLPIRPKTKSADSSEKKTKDWRGSPCFHTMFH